jgi:protoporphyrinogen oxidase
MGRFFPQTTIDDVIRSFRTPSASGYNETFLYPRGGAVQFVDALVRQLPRDTIALDEELIQVDLASRIALTSRRAIRFGRLISSMPLTAFARLCRLEYDQTAFRSNKVLVFNLGFDRKGPAGVHWIYYPERSIRFYRVGFYDNIVPSERMSLYVEIGAAKDEVLDPGAELERVLEDLRRIGIVRNHRLISWHTVILDPAYVHINGRSTAEVARLRALLEGHHVYTVGRYGSWTYCSIEDNIIETRALAGTLGPRR